MASGQTPWWVVGDAATLKITVVQSATKPAAPPTGEVFGPFPTKAAAEKEAQLQASGGGLGSFAQGAVAGAQAGITGSDVPVLGANANPLAFLGYLGEIGHWLGVAVTDLTDIHLWISLGWLFLGLVLLVIGIILWLKHEDLLPKVAPVPVPV